MQEIFSMLTDKFRCAKPVNGTVKILRHTFRKIRKFPTTMKRIDGKAVLSERIISVPNQVVLRFF